MRHAIRLRRRALVALAVTLLGGAVAHGQCVIDYTADLDSPVVYTGGSGNAVVNGTFNCGIVSGTICGYGTYTGNCELSTNDGFVVSCQDGDCAVVPGNPSPSVTCNGTELFAGHATGECAGAVCETDATGTNGPTGNTTHAVVFVDPTTIPAAVQDCGFGGNGVTHVHYTGVTTIPLPAP